MDGLKTKEIIVDGKKKEIVISIPKEEVEDNSDLLDLDKTLELEVNINE